MATDPRLLDRFLADNPSVHAWADGTPANWAVTGAALRYLSSLLSPGEHTLETGAGHSTILFALAGTRHVCITPDPAEALRVRTYCERLGIAPDVTFIHESSDVALPTSVLIPSRLDVVFIDGAHRFPFACLDWHYTESRLGVGGILAVDDYEMPSVRILHDFLCGEDEWERIHAVDRTAFFRRVRETAIVNDCQGQKMNRRSSCRDRRESSHLSQVFPGQGSSPRQHISRRGTTPTRMPAPRARRTRS